MDDRPYEPRSHMTYNKSRESLLYEYEFTQWTREEWRPITIAILTEETSIMQDLIDRGNDITRDDNYTLDAVCRRGLVEMATLLFDNGARFSKTHLGLIWACRYGCTTIVQLLIDNGADVTYDNNKPLLEAHSENRKETCNLLLANGASYPE